MNTLTQNFLIGWTTGQSIESLLKEKDQYSWPPCTKYFTSPAFNTEICFTKQAILTLFNLSVIVLERQTREH